ncbi:hypothetical protein [Flexibacterium corallicola]|uniref:hypothetical protein n=1 Tax=Flexibacterium corallicola TaxID=3037259 RepID=UPI00286ECF49|nr:hypothetical protein [Pseudovibrio sp. M1P-2-3]
MIARESLDLAVKRGILSAGQADELQNFLARQDDRPISVEDAEEVRFVRGFHDIFIVIGIVLLLIGIVTGGSAFGLPSIIVMGTGVLASIGLAEIFTRRQKLSLPSIVLSMAFSLFFALVAGWLVNEGVLGSGLSDLSEWGHGNLFDLESYNLIIVLVSGAIGSLIFNFLYKVPIAAAQAAGLLTLAVLTWFNESSQGVPDYALEVILFVAGVLCFLAAMYFDARDVTRSSLNSDRAFWLHLLSAPLIVHPALSTLAEQSDSYSSALLIVAVVSFLGVLALIVDRRAILVSGLLYLGYAIFSLLGSTSMDEVGVTALALVILGLFVLVLGFGWASIRKIVMAPLINTPVQKLVPSVRK